MLMSFRTRIRQTNRLASGLKQALPSPGLSSHSRPTSKVGCLTPSDPPLLGDSCQSSGLYGPVRSGQVRSGGVSVQCGLVRSSKAWWNDRQNDHEASGEGALRPARMRARPEGQSGLPDRRTGETWFARGPSGRAASPGVKVPTRASVRVTSGAYRSDLHLCRSTRTVRDEDKAL
jgi:hypothetical protein